VLFPGAVMPRGLCRDPLLILIRDLPAVLEDMHIALRGKNAEERG
jgi:hypothetical protein